MQATPAMIDTLSIARDLSDAGVDWKQAQAHAAVIGHVMEQQHADVATKEFVRNQINIVRGELSEKINEVEGKLSKRINEVEGKLSERINEVEGKLSERINAVDAKVSAVDAKVSAVETRIIRWMVITMLGVGGLVVAALSLIL